MVRSAGDTCWGKVLVLRMAVSGVAVVAAVESDDSGDGEEDIGVCARMGSQLPQPIDRGSPARHLVQRHRNRALLPTA